MTFVPVTRRLHTCQDAAKLHPGTKINFACLTKPDFEPAVVPTYAYEQLSHAALSWVTSHQASARICTDVIPPTSASGSKKVFFDPISFSMNV